MTAQRQEQAEFISEDEYLRLESASETKHEYWDGRIVARDGSSGTHCDLMGALMTLIKLQLRVRRNGCVVRGSDQRVKVGPKTMYPDAIVACPPLQYDTKDTIALTDAVVVAEVLSPSTASKDSGSKFLAYLQMPSLQHYLLVAQDAVTVEHRRRNEAGRWEVEVFTAFGDAVILDAIGCTLSLAELYDGLNVQPDSSSSVGDKDE